MWDAAANMLYKAHFQTSAWRVGGEADEGGPDGDNGDVAANDGEAGTEGELGGDGKVCGAGEFSRDADVVY